MNEPVRFFEDKDHAEDYVKYRLAFPDTVFERIVSFVKDGGCQLNVAVDIGCGTGHHSTLPLARVFLNTIGVDVSEEQIKQAPRDQDNMTFRVGRAEDLNFIGNSSVDLVTVATAIHWLDVQAFYIEVDRILKPKGCLAVYWQKRLKLDNKTAEAAIKEFDASTSEFRHEGLKKLYDRQEIPECPYEQWSDETLPFPKHMTAEDYVNRKSTNSYYRQYIKTYPGSTVLSEFKQKLTAAFCEDGTECTRSPLIEMQYAVRVLLCRKP